MKQIAFILTTLLSNLVFSQIQTPAQVDFSLAKVGEHIDGVYMFVNCEPANPYEYIATIEAKLTWWGSSITLEEQFRKIIKKSKNQYVNFNGMIFRGKNFTRVELIKFKGLEASMSGISFKDKVAFIIANEEYTGEVIALIPKDNTVKVKYQNIFDEQIIKTLDVKSVIALTEEQYAENLLKFKLRSDQFKFNVGDSVSWITMGVNKKIVYGTIVKLDHVYHTAQIKYNNEKGEEKIASVGYLNMQKQK
jgi:hypothetical protein